MPKKPRYTVNVGNCGTVTETDELADAICNFAYYVGYASNEYSRGEFPVVLTDEYSEEIIAEYSDEHWKDDHS